MFVQVLGAPWISPDTTAFKQLSRTEVVNKILYLQA